jgi:hypothetical protein
VPLIRPSYRGSGATTVIAPSLNRSRRTTTVRTRASCSGVASRIAAGSSRRARASGVSIQVGQPRPERTQSSAYTRRWSSSSSSAYRGYGIWPCGATLRRSPAATVAPLDTAACYPLLVSVPERAWLELLADVPHRITFEMAEAIADGLRTLRPALLQQLLETVMSVKVRRLDASG